VTRVAWFATALLALPCAAQEGDALPPAGYGTLRQDDIALRLQTGSLLLTVLPLDEHLLRLLAEDSYSALHQLVASRDSALSEAARQAGVEAPSLFLVSLFALDKGVIFNPDDLTLQSRNQFFRPIATVPITLQWGAHRLDQRETAVAIYLFEPGIAIWEPLVVSFGGARNTAWERTLRRLEEERNAVLARAAAARPDSVPNRPQ